MGVSETDFPRFPKWGFSFLVQEWGGSNTYLEYASDSNLFTDTDTYSAA